MRAVPRAATIVALLLRRSVAEFLDDNCTQMAAAISYYVLFSLFPLLIFLVAVLGLALQDSGLQEDVIEAVLDLIPLTEDEGRDEVSEAVRGVAGIGSSALGILGLLGMAWSGSNMFAVIRRSINIAYDLDQRRPLVWGKLMDLAMVLGVGLFFLASVSATTFLRTVRHFSSEMAVLGEAAQRAGPAWDAASYLLPFTLSVAAFAVLYWLVPAAKVRLRDVWPGALVAAVLFEVGKVGFAFYLEHFSNFDVVYGSLGAVVAFLFWVYISAAVLLFGAEVASEYPRIRAGHYRSAERSTLPLSHRLLNQVRSLFTGEHRAGRKAPE